MIKKGIYEHFKGKQYEVIGCGLDTRTEEYLVAYRPLYESEYELFFRPLAEFLAPVKNEGQMTPRFRLIREKEAPQEPLPVLPMIDTVDPSLPEGFSHPPGRPPKNNFTIPKVISG